MNTIIDVGTGEVYAFQGPQLLVSNGIGSCIVYGVYDMISGCGGLAHALLPGRAPKALAEDVALRYAENAVETLLAKIALFHYNRATLVGFLVGGGNVLRRPSDTICEHNIACARRLLIRHQIPLAARSLGGDVRRRVRLDLTVGNFYCAVGDEPEKLLFSRQISEKSGFLQTRLNSIK